MHMPQVEEDFSILRRTREGDLSIESQSADNNVWTVSYERDDGPTAFFLYDRRAKVATFLFESRRDLLEYTLTSMTGVEVTASDGLSIPCYIALPPVKVG
jgi:dipeptidyl aminopeptidase/acylaminoacyl peptidase